VKRFWKEVEVAEDAEGGWAIQLDGRSVKTPAREALRAPTKALADAIAEEWNAVEGEIDPRAMPLTGLANAAIDRIAPDPATFALGLTRYAEADLACYRSDWPPELVTRQAESWDPLLRRPMSIFRIRPSGVSRTAARALRTAAPPARRPRQRETSSASCPSPLRKWHRNGSNECFDRG